MELPRTCGIRSTRSRRNTHRFRLSPRPQHPDPRAPGRANPTDMKHMKDTPQDASHPPIPLHNPQTAAAHGGFSFLSPRQLRINRSSLTHVPLRVGLGFRRSHDMAPVNQAQWPMLTTTVRLLEVSAPSGCLSIQDPRIPHRKARTSSSMHTRVCCRDSRRR